MKKINTNQGFTIIELLVVAAIIALIVTVVLGSLGVAQSKSRDSRRIQELQSVQKALELNYITTNNYPPITDPNYTTEGMVKNTIDKKTSSMTATLQPLIDSNSMTSIPFPPPQGSSVDGSYYYRTSDPDDYSHRYTCGGKGFGGGTNIPYMLYFISELPQNLPKMAVDGNITTNGYCFTNF